MTRFTFSLSLMAALLCVETSRAGQPYVVSELSGGHIWRIEDANGDGDALDLGERTLWGDGFIGAQGMTADDRAVYVTEKGLPDGGNQIVRLSDTNGDGDALDFGERTIWLDGLDNPRDISFDAVGISYLSEFDSNQVWRMIDANADGDVLDVGEKVLFADGIGGPQWTLPQAGSLLVAAFNSIQIHRLTDHNGDGDAFDIGENQVVAANINQPVGLLDDGEGGFYFSSIAADTVYRAHDRNGDVDMLDVAEVLSYADHVYGLLDGPAGLAAFDGGGFLVANSLNNQIKLVRDKNGDGDALDLGDVTLFADGINQPIDVVALPTVLPGDYNDDGVVDAADYVVWRKFLSSPSFDLPNEGVTEGTVTSGDYDVWRNNYGNETGGGGGAANSSIPEPCSSLLACVGCAFLLRASHVERFLRNRRFEFRRNSST